jgi:hypothetical protein
VVARLAAWAVHGPLSALRISVNRGSVLARKARPTRPAKDAQD